MNKTYRSIWNEADQTWVAAPETAAARGKSMRRLAVLVTSAVGLAASGTSAFATTTTTAPTPGTVGQGGLELCSGAKGYSWGSSGGSQSIDCSTDGKGTTDGLAFTLNNAADTKGGYGFGASTVQVAGYQNGTLNIKGASIMVYGPTTFDSIVTMSNQKIVQMAPGLVAANSTEAVNGSQLYATNQNITNLQDYVADAVMYDTPAHDTLTLGGTNAKVPVALRNVAAGDLAPASTDAVNGSQLYATNVNVANLQDQVADAVMYDTPAHDTLTLGGTNAKVPVALRNVAAGDLSPASTDAVNGSQLYATNVNVASLQGQVADAVMYDTPAHDTLTLGGTNAKVPVALRNVAAGDLSSSSTDAVNGSQLYEVSQGVADNTTYINNLTENIVNGKIGIVQQNQATRDITVGKDTDGTIVDLTGTAGVRQLTGLAAGTGAGDAVNVAQMQSAGFQFDNVGGVLNKAVTYDAGSIAAGSPSITLATGDGFSQYHRNGDRNADFLPAGTIISNVANGIQDTDAANVGQVQDMINSYFQGGGATANSARILAAADTSSGASQLAASTGADAVQYDSSAHDTITLSSTSGGNVKITGLQDATLAVGSTDAVTGQQLFATNQQVANLDQAIQNVSNNGSTALSTSTTSGAATAAGAQSIAIGGGAAATGDNSTAIGDKANASAKNSVAIGANSIANREDAVSVGQEGAERQIVNVKAGTSGTDAVNVDQMNSALAQQNTAVNQQISGLRNSINTVEKNAYAGVAAAMAMPNLTPSAPGRTVVAAGGGYYKGGSAGAVGVTYRSANAHWLMNGAVAVTNNGDAGVRAQIGYEF
ncbi:ESPR-type extended signal peptide-containing protein [Paraburkholderia dinghuensis]|nr:ESPR-type extended signal peptide-containing protein [Paraburkholderia dinghuensis]